MLKEKNETNGPVVWWKLIGLALAYFIAARIGLAVATYSKTVSFFWPATGISLSILYIFGRNYWPAVSLGAFAANSFNGLALPTIFIIAIGNTLHGVVGNKVLQFIWRRENSFGLHARSVGILSAAFSGAFVSASIGSLSLILGQYSGWQNFESIWFTWFTGDLMGAIIYFPFLIAYFTKSLPSTENQKSKNSIFHFISLVLAGLSLLWLIFIKDEGSIYLFFLFPYLFWVLATAGERGITLATVFISILGVYSVKYGYGVFKHGSLNSDLLNLELFILSIGLCSLMMVDFKKNSPLKQPGQILFVSWLFAGLLFFGFYIKSTIEADKHFKQIISATEPIIEAKLNLYFSALQSGKGLFAASGHVRRDEWKAFLEHGQFNIKLPGTDGLGVVFRVKNNELKSFINKTRADQAPDFTYHILPDLTEDQKKKAALSDEHYIVTYIEPREANQFKIGLDLASEPKRKTGADIARDLGTPALSEKISLIDDPKNEPAFLLFYPLFQKGAPPKSLQERREKIIGWIYTPLRVKPFFQSIFSEENFKEISYSISGHDGQLLAKADDFEALPDSHIEKRSFRVGNRTFDFEFKKSNLFYSTQDAFSSWVGAISSIISLLIAAFIVSLQNVKTNALKLAEQKTADLKASEELWKHALQGAGDCVWDWDIKNNYFKITKEIEQLVGYTEEEMQGNPDIWKALIHIDDLPVVAQCMKDHLVHNKPYVNEHRVRCKNGQYRWTLTRGKVVSRDAENNPLRMVGTMSDITVFKEAEHVIERQRSRLQAIYESSSDGLLLFTDNQFIDCNTRALHLFGHESREELLKLHPGELSPPHQPDGMDSMTKANFLLRQAFTSGITRFEWMHRKKSGEVFPAEVTLTVFDYDGQKFIHGCVRDISEEKQVEASLASQREKLIVAAKMSSLGEMAGGIAHEINNPLAIIVGKVSQLKRKLESQPENLKSELESLTVVETTAKRIASIVKGLSAFSRNAENDNMERLEVLPLILDTLELSKERFRFHSVELKLNIQITEKTYVTGRPAQLLQVLLNLLNNAYDAVEFLDERWVEVTIKTNSSVCNIVVTDSGPGIPQHILEKIMTPFFTTKKVGKGTGLGLSISKGIIEDHNGKLFYDSKNPHTSFIIELPIA